MLRTSIVLKEVSFTGSATPCFLRAFSFVLPLFCFRPTPRKGRMAKRRPKLLNFLFFFSWFAVLFVLLFCSCFFCVGACLIYIYFVRFLSLPGSFSVLINKCYNNCLYLFSWLLVLFPGADPRTHGKWRVSCFHMDSSVYFRRPLLLFSLMQSNF